MSDSLSAVGAILTIILFGFIFELDKILRKVFNMVGGVKTVKTIDYESMLTHPVRTAEQFKGMASDAKAKFADFRNNVKSGEIKEDISQGLVRFKNNAIEAAGSIKNDIKENVKSLDGKNVKISKEAVEKEKKKMENPSIPAKILSGIQGFTYNTVGLGVTAVENLSKKTKQELFRLKSFAKTQTEKLKQNATMVKKIGFIIKNETKIRINKMKKNNQSVEPSNEEAKKDTVLNFNSPEIQIEELKNGIETSKGDIPAVVYATLGPQAFIYKGLGSPHMGLSILASENYEKKIYRNPISEKDKRHLVAPALIRIKMNIPLEDDEEKEQPEAGTIRKVQRIKVISIEEAKKRYQFVRFNGTAVRNITRGLNRRYVANDLALSALAAVGQNIMAGTISFRGTAAPTSIRRSSIKYTAKSQAHNQNKMQANIEFGKVIPFPGVRERKQNLDMAVSNYHERVQDGNWAVLTSISDDIVQTHEADIGSKTEKIRKAEDIDVVVKQLEDMGRAVRVNDNVSVIFGKNMQSNVASQTPNEGTVKTQVMSNESQVRYAQKVAQNEPIDVQIATEIVAEDAETTLEAVTDRAIIQTAIKLDMPLETIKFGEDTEAREEIVTTLVEQGVISAGVLKDTDAMQSVIAGIENRQDVILNENPDKYIDSVMQQEIIKAIQEIPVQASEKESATETVIDADFVQAEPNYDRLSDYIKKVARESVKAEAERMKSELMAEAQEIVDTVQEGIKDAKEVYSLGDLDKQAKEKLEATIEETKEKVKAAFKTKSKIKESKDKKDSNSNGDNRETFIVYVMGAVLLEGRYELPSGSRIYEAIKAAGGPTDEADLTAIPFYDFIYDGETIRIPKRSDDDIEATLEKCRPIVEKVVKDYLVENNISDIEALKKLVHKKMLLSELQKALREQPVTKNQISNLLEERIKEMKFIRDGLKKAKGNMKVVEKGKTKVKSSENLQNEKERQARGIRNNAEASLDEAIRKLNNFEENSEESAESNEKINDLLRQLDSQRELVLVNSSNSTKQEARLRYIDETPENMMNKLLGRV